MLAELQARAANGQRLIENTKAQLRQSQRTVAQVRPASVVPLSSDTHGVTRPQLTRQTEDLKEGRERLRIEIEGLNNVRMRCRHGHPLTAFGIR